MKKLLIVSFDLIREGESSVSLAIASLLAYLKADHRYGSDFLVEHLSLNMLKIGGGGTVEALRPYFASVDFTQIDFVALSAYVWNEYLTNDLIDYLRVEFGYQGKIILGGYQISYSSQAAIEYPDCQYFIDSYAEKSLLDIVTGENVNDNFPRLKVDFTQLPSPYLTKEIPLSTNQGRVRLETKRGCPYRCSFCAHRDLTYNKVYKHDLDKVFREIALFKEKAVRKINIIDPIFNAGKGHIEVMSEMDRVGLSSLVSIQARFETIKGERGRRFMEVCERLNIELEFGLQTAVLEESKVINRKNNPEEIKRVMKELKDRGINYEISLIYGLPTQTLDSFRRSIDFARENGCKSIVAFPMMLLKGTELFAQKDKFGFEERELGEYNIPVVVKSDSFTEEDWYEMKRIAECLGQPERI